MKKYFLIMIMAFAQCYAFGQGKIEFSELSKDLGEINTIENDFEVSFNFMNVGNQPIKIQKVTLAFNTARAFYPKTEIQPGGKGTITIRGFIEISGHFKKGVTVMTTGFVELTRLFLSGNNINPDGKTRAIEDLARGGSYDSWIQKNQNRNLVGIDKNIIYNVDLGVQINSHGKITKSDYNKTNLPPSICKEIDRLTKTSPDFSFFVWDEHVVYNININNYRYTNPADEAYRLVDKFPDITHVVESIKGYASPISTFDRKIKELNKANSFPLYFIVERNGDITNLMGALNNEYCTKDNISRVNEVIRKIKTLGKVKPGERKGKPCRTICIIAASLNK